MKTSPPFKVGLHGGCIVSENAEGLRLGGSTGPEAVEYYGGNLIAESMTPENAEFFARAGNAFDPLVKALSQMNQMGGDERGGYCICPKQDGSAPDDQHASGCADARAALELALKPAEKVNQ